jgi:hypothetical protein
MLTLGYLLRNASQFLSLMQFDSDTSSSILGKLKRVPLHSTLLAAIRDSQLESASPNTSENHSQRICSCKSKVIIFPSSSILSRTQIADRLGRLLDPYPTAPLFIRFPSSYAPAPASLPSTHHRQQFCVLVWCDLPSVASTGPIFKRCEIVTFVTSVSGRDRRPHKSIIMHRNDTESNLKHLLDVSYNGVGLGGGVSPLPAPTSSISAIFRWTVSFSSTDIFAYTRACTAPPTWARPRRCQRTVSRKCPWARARGRRRPPRRRRPSPASSSRTPAGRGAAPPGGSQPQRLERPPLRAGPLDRLEERAICPPRPRQ